MKMGNDDIPISPCKHYFRKFRSGAKMGHCWAYHFAKIFAKPEIETALKVWSSFILFFYCLKHLSMLLEKGTDLPG